MKWLIKWKVKGAFDKSVKGKDVFESEDKPTKQDLENIVDDDVNGDNLVSDYRLPNMANAINECTAGCNNFWILSVKKLKGDNK